MYKTVRSLALASLLALVAVPAVKADRWGTNPKPAPGSGEMEDVSTMSTFEDAILFNLGML